MYVEFHLCLCGSDGRGLIITMGPERFIVQPEGRKGLGLFVTRDYELGEVIYSYLGVCTFQCPNSRYTVDGILLYLR